MQRRYALYYVPSPQTALALLGSALLGRSSENGLPIPQGLVPDVPAETLKTLTTEPRRYGLHATLKAPFFLKAGANEQDIIDAAYQFALTREPIVLPKLTAEILDSFIALTPPQETALNNLSLHALEQLAAATVAFFEPLRGELSKQEAARRGNNLTPRQKNLLDQWGYPFVFDCYRFHITLTGPIANPLERERMRRSMEKYFGLVLNQPIRIDGVCLCRQDMGENPSTGTLRTAPFNMVKRFSFGGVEPKEVLQG